VDERCGLTYVVRPRACLNGLTKSTKLSVIKSVLPAEINLVRPEYEAKTADQSIASSVVVLFCDICLLGKCEQAIVVLSMHRRVVGLYMYIKRKSKAILVTDRGSPQRCEMSRLSHFLDNLLIDGAGRPLPPRNIPDILFC
jgi:hypothetical protein